MPKFRHFFATMFSLVATACSSTPPKLGLIDGNLSPCDNTSHCVNSQATDASKVEPLAYSDSPADAKARLRKAIGEFPRTTFTAETANYWRVEFKSFLFRFVDDVEFLFKNPGKVDVRSGSRVGASDLGVNRRRIEAIREAFEKRD